MLTNVLNTQNTLHRNNAWQEHTALTPPFVKSWILTVSRRSTYIEGVRLFVTWQALERKKETKLKRWKGGVERREREVIFKVIDKNKE